MKLTRLHLRRAPGLDKGLGELRFEQGLNVVFGPNESGKSTLARAIQATLWPEQGRPSSPLDVDSDWEDAGRSWTARHDGRTIWTRAGELDAGPSLPGPENRPAYRLHLRDLIAERGDVHDDFAQRVREALDGGYDLRRAATPRTTSVHGRHEKSQLKAAEAALREIEGERRRLAGDMDDLVRLEADQAAAERAAHEATLLVRVVKWQEARAELADARARLERDPTPEALRGHEAAELERIEQALAECDADREALEERLERARGAIAAQALPETVPEAHRIEHWFDEAARLAELQRDVARLREARDAAVAREVSARAALQPVDAGTRAGERAPVIEGADGVAHVDAQASLLAPGPAQIDALAGWLDARARLADDRRALESRRAQLGADAAQRPDATPVVDGEPGSEPLVIARDGVAAHLRSGPGWVAPLGGAALFGAAAAAAFAFWPELAGLLGLELALDGATGSSASSASWASWASWEGWAGWASIPAHVGAVGAAAATVAALLGGGLGAWVGRLVARRRFGARLRSLGVTEAALRGQPGVLFDALDAQLREARRREERLREQTRIDAELQALEAQAPALEARRSDLVGRLGIDPGLEDLSLVELARRLAAHRDAALQFAAEQARLDAALRELAEGEAALLARLAPFVPGVAVVAEATRALAALQRRIADAASAAEAAREARAELHKVEARRAEKRAARAALLEPFGLHDEDAASAARQLDEWTAALGARKQKEKAVDELAAVVADHARALESRPDLLKQDEVEVQRRLREAEEQAGRVKALGERIGGIRKEIELAESGDGVEAALARVRAARDALEARRTEVFESAAARLLLGEISGEIDRHQRPEVLARATELFGRFTRHRYELEVDDAGAHARFVARSTASDERKQLDELSDGTRMQLLLAARLAFVHEGERGVHPPLVLDEALSSSDATRMAAMTDALVAEAGTGRQIFYMTNDPGDVADWQAACDRAGAPPPHVIRLGDLQRDEHAAVWDGFEPPAQHAPVPRPPAGCDASTYAAMLGVPLPDPWAELGQLHLFHLLADDLEMLHRVLEIAQVELLGHFESRRRAGLAETLLGPEVVERIEFRRRVAERFFAAWRKGRGKRLRAGDLDGCEALTDVYRLRLTELAEAVDGDAAQLMQRVANKDPRVKGLATKRRLALEEYLEEQGFLSNEEPFEDAALVTEVTSALGGAVFGHDSAEAHARLRDAASLVRLWTRLLRHGDDAA